MADRPEVGVGQKIASLVWEAEKRFPGPGMGAKKSRWVAREAAKDVPPDDNPSARFGKVMGRYLLRVGIEIAVAMLAHMQSEFSED